MMKKRIHKITSILLVILLAVTAVSLAACGSDSEGPADDGAVTVISDGDGNVLTVEGGEDDAAEDGVVYTYEDEGVNYKLYADGTLIVSGKGDARINFSEEQIKKVIAEEGITRMDFGNGYENLTEVVFPGSVEIIYACYNCPNLTKVSIHEGVTHIFEGAFRGCTSLAEIEMPDSMVCVGKNAFEGTALFEEVDGILYVGNVACGYTGDPSSFQGNLTLRKDTRIIADNAFVDLRDITSVTFPDGLVRIGELAFGDCSMLSELNVPDSVFSIGRFAFSGTQSSDDSIVYVGKVAYSYERGTGGKDLVLKEGTVGIADFLFENAIYDDYFDTVTLPSSLKWIGDYSKILLSEQSKQKEIVIPDGVTFMGAYIGTESDTQELNIVFPASVTYIGGIGDNATIIAPKGSYAETYALKNHILFKER